MTSVSAVVLLAVASIGLGVIGDHWVPSSWRRPGRTQFVNVPATAAGPAARATGGA